MKTIIVYILLGIFIFSIFVSAFTKKTDTKSLLIQAADSLVSSELLAQSAQIISNRLHNFGFDKFEIKVIPEKKQIQVLIKDQSDLKTIAMLMTRKGSLAFYETYDCKELTELLQEDTHLFSLLGNSNAYSSDARIGCLPVSGIEKVESYLNTLKLNQPCKFTWSYHSGDDNMCLYALKTDDERKALIGRAEIDSFKCEKSMTERSYALNIKLKESASELWADATKRNVHKAIAIVLDEIVIAAPVVNSVVKNGSCQIAGNFTLNEVKYIAVLVNNAELPVSFQIAK